MSQNYFSDLSPDFAPRKLSFKSIPAYQFSGDLAAEIKKKRCTKAEVLELFECMMIIREFEEMIVKQRTGAYEVIKDYTYRGPTHLSVGQEATATGICSVLQVHDYITSTH